MRDCLSPESLENSLSRGLDVYHEKRDACFIDAESCLRSSTMLKYL
jgi:hypothetical protein